MQKVNIGYIIRLTLFGIGVALLILEILVRIFIKETFYNPARVSEVFLTSVPNFIQRSTTDPNQEIFGSFRDEPPHTIAVNEWGYRGNSFAAQKASDTIRVVTLGGSAAFDADAPEGFDFPHYIAKFINLGEFGLDVEAINAASAGYTTYLSSARLRNEVWFFEPDYVLVYHCWNDLKYFSDLSAENSIISQNNVDIERLWKAYQHANYTNVFDRVLGVSHLYLFMRAAWRDPSFDTEGFVRQAELTDKIDPDAVRQFELALQSIIDFNESIGAKTILVQQARLVAPDNTEEERDNIRNDFTSFDDETLQEAYTTCDTIMQDLATRNENTSYIDMVYGSVPTDLEHFRDHVHLTPTGSLIVSEIVGKALNEIIRADLAN